MAQFRCEDSANFAPDEITVEGTVYRRADLPIVINTLSHLFPPTQQPKHDDDQKISVLPTWKPLTFTPDSVEFNGRTYRKTK